MPTTDERLAALESRLTHAETRARRVQWVAAILTFLASIVASVATGWVTLQERAGEADRTRDTLRSTESMAELDRWLEHARIAMQLRDDFLGPDDNRIQFAFEVVAHFDPAFATRLDEARGSADAGVAIDNRADELREQMIRQLVHEERDVRYAAAEGLQASVDPALVHALLAFGREDPDAAKRSGGARWRIYNVMTVLVDLARVRNPAVSVSKRVDVLDYTGWARVHDKSASPLADELVRLLSIDLQP